MWKVLITFLLQLRLQFLLKNNFINLEMTVYLQLILASSITSTLLVASTGNYPEIKLTTAKNHVLPAQMRASILEISEAFLNRGDETFLVTVGGIQNPYIIEAEEEVLVEPEKKAVVYDDELILELIETNFSPQVRGNIAKGDVYYLQLNGGGLLAEGASFPAQIPQVEGESYTVIISEITSDGYVLKMNDATQQVDFEKKSGAIKNSTK